MFLNDLDFKKIDHEISKTHTKTNIFPKPTD